MTEPPVEVAAGELAAAELTLRSFVRKQPYDPFVEEIGLLLAEYDRRGAELDRHISGESYRTVVGQRNEWIGKTLGLKLENTELSLELDRTRAFLLEATGTLPFHGFTNDELGDPWVRWLERVAAYLTEMQG